MAFDGQNDALTVDLYNGLDQTDYSLMAWLYLTDTLDVASTLFNNQDGSTTRFRVSLNTSLDTLLVHNGTVTTSLPLTLSLNSWHHLAVVVEDNTWIGYLDGSALGLISQTFTLTDDLPLHIGATTGDNNHFRGLMDEVVVYSQALDPSTIYHIAHPVASDVSSLELRLRHLQDADQADGEGTWVDITPMTTMNSFATWSYEMPDELEGPYKLDLKIADSHGYTRTVLNAWGGVIDTIAPRITLSATTNISDETHVYCYAYDQYLDETSWDCPLSTTPTVTYEDASWFVDAFSQTDHIVALETGPESIVLTGQAHLTACDTYGNCDTAFYASGLNDVADIEDYMVVYALNLPSDADYSGSSPAYHIDNSASISSFDRVAYYLELDNGTEQQWVWVSMDAFTSNATDMGIPYNFIYDLSVDNLFVASNVDEVTTGGPFTGGYLEFWHNCYSETADSGLDGNSSLFDFDDTIGASNCYGSFQVHNTGLDETILAWNGWADSGSHDDLGIGSNHNGTHPDWTNENNSSDWLTRTLYALVRVPVKATDDSYTATSGVTLTVAATGVMSNDQAGLTATLEEATSHGDLSFNGDGSFVYTPTIISGQDSFRYSLSDGFYLTDTATVTLTIDPARCYVETTGNEWADAAGDDMTPLQKCC